MKMTKCLAGAIHRTLFSMFVCAVFSPVTEAAQSQAMHGLSVTLKPGPMDVEHGSGYVDMVLTIPAPDTAAGDPLLTLPIVTSNVETIATTLQNLEATDTLGSLPLNVKDDPVTQEYSRHWIARRKVVGDVTVRYRAPIDNTPPNRGTSPPFSLRTEGGGFSGTGRVFILLPENAKPAPIAIHWDLTGMGNGATATSSFGEGDTNLESGPINRLENILFMAGPMSREPTQVLNEGYSSAWLGSPPFDPRPLMEWGGQLHAWMSHFFQDTTEPPYRVFLRYNPINAGGGTALIHSFLLTYGKESNDPLLLKGLLSHEMVHTWTAVDDNGGWYVEGVAVYYQNLLPLRAGLIKSDEFLVGLNQMARRYYSNILNNTPDKQIDAHFWEDTRIRVLPYDRGMFYLAVLDGQIRRASSGSRSIDDLIREMDRRRSAGKPTTEKVWVGLITTELGKSGRALHEAMLSGKLMAPKSGDFGPCFARTTAKARRFELGFDPKSLVGNVKTIKGLKAGSEAARAGLLDGDVVTYAVAMDSLQFYPDKNLTLRVTRADKSFEITYFPRGESVDVYQWERLPGIPETSCAY